MDPGSPPTLLVQNEKVNMIGGYHIIQYQQFEAPSGFEEPLKPSLPIPGKSKQKFTFMAPMGYMPNMTSKLMTISPCHAN